MIYRVLLQLSLVFALSTPSAFASETLVSAQALSREPVNISSKQLEADGNQNFVTFVGEVVARQGDLVIYADELKVMYAPESQAMDRAEAKGNVRVVRGDQVATSDLAIYDSREETILLSGNPKVKQGESFLVGSEITIYLREQRSVVHGSGGDRVNAVFSPEEKQ